jgi:S1-C subfamily serine protease
VKVEPPKPAVATISRKEFNAALADFGALSTSIDASFTAQGLAVAKVAPGSVFAKAGLQAGDTITAVDGKPLRTLDDAANLYARAGSIKNASVTVSRDGKSQTLRVAIQ